MKDQKVLLLPALMRDPKAARRQATTEALPAVVRLQVVVPEVAAAQEAAVVPLLPLVIVVNPLPAQVVAKEDHDKIVRNLK